MGLADALPANYSSNFKQHQQEWLQSRRPDPSKPHDSQGPSMGPAPATGGDAPKATDQRVVERFIKNFKWRK